MKKGLFILLVSFNAQADYYLETAIILHIADWAQTRHIATNSRFIENNPILGKRPTLKRVNIYMFTTGIALVSLHYALPVKFRKSFRVGWMVNNIVTVGTNYQMGIVMKL